MSLGRLSDFAKLLATCSDSTHEGKLRQHPVTTPFPIKVLKTPFNLPHPTPSSPSAMRSGCVRFIYAFINQLTKCKFCISLRGEIKQRI